MEKSSVSPEHSEWPFWCRVRAGAMSEQPAAENDYAIVPLVIHGECKVSLLTPISPLYNLAPITQIGHRKKKEKKNLWLPPPLPNCFTHRQWCITHESLGPTYWLLKLDYVGVAYLYQVRSERTVSSLPESQAHNYKLFASYPKTIGSHGNVNVTGFGGRRKKKKKGKSRHGHGSSTITRSRPDTSPTTVREYLNNNWNIWTDGCGGYGCLH